MAVRIGPAPARESYLNIERIIAAAREAGVEAIHPGYGFLSENADFAEACAAAGLIFVGPPPAAIRAMGSKSEAKAIMAKAGVPLVPGYHGEAQAAAALAKEAAKIGYPVLIKASADGQVVAEYPLPADVNVLQKSNGFEGVAVTGSGTSEWVYIAFQREWSGDTQRHVRIGRYDMVSGEWTFVYYPIEAPSSPNGGWVGLSALTSLGRGDFAVIERDNQQGPKAQHKRLYRFSVAGLAPAPQGGVFPAVTKTLVRDLLPDLKATGGWVVDKVEGAALAADGRFYVVSDNDGVEDATGETRFLRLGKLFD